MVNVKIEIEERSFRETSKFVESLPERVKKATSNALLELGLGAAGTAAEQAPYLTGNLRRSIHTRSDDRFPFWAPLKGARISDPPKLTKVDGFVWFGTNLVYARTQNENNRSRAGFMEKGLANAESRAQRVFAFELDKEGVK
jgi:hypothetical protein